MGITKHRSSMIFTKKDGDVMTGVLTQNGTNLGGSAYRSQSFQNLVRNAGFESWSNGISLAPDAWTLAGAGATIEREGTNVKNGLYSGKVTRAGTNTNLYTPISNPTQFIGKTVTLGVWVKTATANAGIVTIYDGADYNSSYHTGDNTWQFLTVSRLITTGLSYVYLEIKTTDTIVYFDSVILVEGSVVPAFSHRPLYDNGVDIVTSKFGLSALGIARAKYDFAVDGGAISTITLATNAIIPDNAIIIVGVVNSVAACTSGGAATIAVGTSAGSSSSSILAAEPVASFSLDAMLPVIPLIATPIKLTAAGQVTITIADFALTAGVIEISLIYIQAAA